MFVFKHIMAYEKHISVCQGTSVILKSRLNKIIKKICVFSDDVSIRKFINRTHKMKVYTKENSEIEKVDVDKLMLMFLNEYYDKRK